MLSFYLAMISEPGDRDLFTELYVRYKSLMYNTAYNILGDVGLSEDAVQEAILAVIRNISHIHNTDSPSTRSYLIIITRNIAFKIYNGNKKYLLSQNVPEANQQGDEFLYEDLRQTVFSCLKQMDKKYADALLLRIFFELPESEIARIQGVSQSNIRMRIKRGREMMKKLLESKDYDE